MKTLISKKTKIIPLWGLNTSYLIILKSSYFTGVLRRCIKKKIPASSSTLGINLRRNELQQRITSQVEVPNRSDLWWSPNRAHMVLPAQNHGARKSFMELTKVWPMLWFGSDQRPLQSGPHHGEVSSEVRSYKVFNFNLIITEVHRSFTYLNGKL